jgi:hypothetical protein
MPRVITISLKKETGTTTPGCCVTGLPASIFAKKINNKKDILQTIASLEKKDITFIEEGLGILSPK